MYYLSRTFLLSFGRPGSCISFFPSSCILGGEEDKGPRHHFVIDFPSHLVNKDGGYPTSVDIAQCTRCTVVADGFKSFCLPKEQQHHEDSFVLVRMEEERVLKILERVRGNR